MIALQNCLTPAGLAEFAAMHGIRKTRQGYIFHQFFYEKDYTHLLRKPRAREHFRRHAAVRPDGRLISLVSPHWYVHDAGRLHLEVEYGSPSIMAAARLHEGYTCRSHMVGTLQSVLLDPQFGFSPETVVVECTVPGDAHACILDGAQGIIRAERIILAEAPIPRQVLLAEAKKTDRWHLLAEVSEHNRSSK